MHVNATGDIGVIKIVRDENIGSGLRRITALAGMSAVLHYQELHFLTEDLAATAGIETKYLKEKFTSTLKELKDIKTELNKTKLKLALSQCEKITSQRQIVGDVTILVGKFDDLEAETLREVGDHLKKGFKKVLIVLGSVSDEKVLLVAMADDEAVKEGIHAGKLINKVAAIVDGEMCIRDRVIVDHIRALAFMIADGVLPSNEGRGYVLRRLLRRASRYGRLLGLDRPFLIDLLPELIEIMADPYKELVEYRSTIESVISVEEKRFSRTLDQGSALLEEEISRITREGGVILPGETAFVLYDTYGFPLELTEEICQEHGLKVDREGFIKCMEHQRKTARAASKQLSSATETETYSSIAAKLGYTEFVGYQTSEASAKVVAILKESQETPEAHEGEEIELFLDKTPFYAEKGGQVGDKGWIESATAKLEVLDTYYVLDTLIAHKTIVKSGYIAVNDEVEAKVDTSRRNAIRRHHTSTHIIHEALVRAVSYTHLDVYKRQACHVPPG